MKKNNAFARDFFRRHVGFSSSGNLLVYLLVILVLFSACASKMSIEEAKQVTVSLSEKSFIPPPRRIDDILSILDQPGQLDAEALKKNIAIANASPPDTENPLQLMEFYFERGHFARELGRYKQNLEDLRTALSYAENENGERVSWLKRQKYALILTKVAHAEGLAGNLIRAIDLLEKSLEVYPRALTYVLLAFLYWEMGDFQSAEKSVNAGIQFCDKWLSSSELKPQKRNSLENKRANMLAKSLEYKSKYIDAEVYRRLTVENLAISLGQEKAVFKGYINHRENLTLNLAQQGRLVEAELEARETLKETIMHTGKFSGATAEMLGTFGHILLLQGRLTDAEKISREVIKILKGFEFSENSLEMIAVRKNLANNLVMQMNYTEAMRQFDFIKANVAGNPYLSKKFMERNPLYMLCLLKMGRTGESMDAVSNAYRTYSKYFGAKHVLVSGFLGLRGMVHAKMKADKQAMQDFSEAVPNLLQKTSNRNDNYLVKHLSGAIVDAYMDLLFKIHEENRGKEFKIIPSSEIFKLCQVINYSIVQSALGASGARAAAVDPILADLVRKEQDALKQIDALHGTLSNAIAAPPDQQNPDALKDLMNTIDTLSNARVILLDEIKIRFPKYSDFTDPQPVRFSAAQKLLHPGEALIVLYPSAAGTYGWAIPYKGKIRFAVLLINKETLQEIITPLREALDSESKTFGDIPEFDLARAFKLYNNLLKPIEDGWKDSRDLIIVAPGPLAQLPFSVLPTISVKLRPEKYGLFENYRKIPWLIRKVSITRQPSVFSFVTLRELPEGDPDRKALAAFGDPIFNRAQLALTENGKSEPILDFASEKNRLHIRGIRITEEGNLDSTQILSSKLDSLNRLPDTAEEIRSIAETLGADPTKDIFLGKFASEKKVKSIDLTNRQVIAFASHALVPGDLDGLDQPAIALSAPSVTGDNEDGLLTMGEVLKLKLNADWVILSACNTGAASGAGAEAVSGLGRAFFYAGTRTILVSMWPVETSSARKLTTGLFRYQMGDKRLSRARAFRKSMLDLIDGPGLKDDATGKIVASYAHPLFWAPFIVVGESGRNAN